MGSEAERRDARVGEEECNWVELRGKYIIGKVVVWE